MKRLLVWILVFAAAACATTAPAQLQKDAAKQILDRAVADYQAERYTEAWPAFLQAQALGHMKAPRYIGLMYLNGLGVEKNAVRAFDAFQTAADQGDITAQYWLGYLYQHGIGTAQNDAQALK